MMPKPDQVARHAERLLEAARALVDRPDDVEARTTFVHRAFNHDWAAAAIVALAENPAAASPVGRRYLYPSHDGGHVWRFETGGREINGSRPIRSEPVYAPPPPPADAEAHVLLRRCLAALKHHERENRSGLRLHLQLFLDAYPPADPTAAGDATSSLGRRLCDAWQAANAPENPDHAVVWDDFDPQQQACWTRAAALFLADQEEVLPADNLALALANLGGVRDWMKAAGMNPGVTPYAYLLKALHELTSIQRRRAEPA